MPAPHHSLFYRLDALPDSQPTVPKHSENLKFYQATSNSYGLYNMGKSLCGKSYKENITLWDGFDQAQ